MGRQDIFDFLRRCREIDTCNTGFLRAFRHPGESYIDYVAMLDAIHLRQQRIFDEALWFHFQRICQSSGRGGGTSGLLSLDELGMLFSDPVIVGLLMHEIPESAGAEEATVCHQLQQNIAEHCSQNGTCQIEFRELSVLLRRVACAYPLSMQTPPEQAAQPTAPV